jgi:hypothetical protein
MPWCEAAGVIARDWERCKFAFNAMNTVGVVSSYPGSACRETLENCRTLVTNETLRPIAAKCLRNCDAKSGCKETLLAQALSHPKVCGDAGVPNAIRFNLLAVVWGPIVQFIFTLTIAFAQASAAGSNAVACGRGSVDQFTYRKFPIAQWVNLVCQGCLLYHLLEFGVQSVANAPNGICGFLILSTAPMWTSTGITLTAILAPTITLVTDDKAQGVVVRLLVSFLPAGLACISLLIFVATLTGLLISGIPALIATFPMWGAGLILAGILPAVYIFVFYGFDTLRQLAAREKEKKMVSWKTLGKCGVPLFLLVCQVFSYAGVLAWAQYVTHFSWYVPMWDFFWDSFGVPPFEWNFDFTLYFAWPAWERIFTFSLYPSDIFGAAVATQVLFAVVDIVLSNMPCAAFAFPCICVFGRLANKCKKQCCQDKVTRTSPDAGAAAVLSKLPAGVKIIV